MRSAQFDEALYRFLDIVPGEWLFAMFHLDVDSAPLELHLDVFVALDVHTPHRQRRRRQQALNGVKMLKEEAAMHGFDPNELSGIQYACCLPYRLDQGDPSAGPAWTAGKS